MAKVKVRKKLPKGKILIKPDPNFKPKGKEKEKFKDNYFNYHDDIKINSRRNDW